MRSWLLGLRPRLLVALLLTSTVTLAVAALGDSDDEVRLAAADAAIRLRATGATDAVAGWLNAPDVRLRRKACEVARALQHLSRIGAGIPFGFGHPAPAAATPVAYCDTACILPPLLTASKQ